ncbi:MAG: nitroreductase family protein [Ignavibacteria bacterium]
MIELAIKTAGTAPSGANKQPWRFVIVESPVVKKEIRIAAEKEEKESYERRMPQSWLDDLAPLGTDWHKEFLEIAPYLIVVFKIDFVKSDNELKKHYYVNESVGLATGMLLAALQNMGLSTLTHTPSR